MNSFYQDFKNFLNEASIGNQENALAAVKELATMVAEQGYHLYIIGGAARDSVRGATPNDYDLNTDMPAEEFAGLLDDGFVVHRRVKDLVHGTHNGEEFEASSSRGISIADQCKECDLTINALAMDPLTGRIIDPEGGVADIKKHVLRFTDWTKAGVRDGKLLENVWRLIRFIAQLGWTVEDDTVAAVKEFLEVRNGDVHVFTKIRDKALKGKYIQKAYDFCDELGIREKMFGGK